MKILEASEIVPELWNQALLHRPDGHFLQSWNWYQFQTNLGNMAWPVAIVEEGRIINQLLLIKLTLPGGVSLLYSPRGSLINPSLSLSDQKASQKLLLDRIRQIGRENHSILFRLDPELRADNRTAETFYKTMGFVLDRHKQIQPLHSLILNLDHPLPGIQQSLKPKTRYNIKLAEKLGVTVEIGTANDLPTFIRLTHLTAQRDNFTPHSDRYYQKQYATLHPANLQELYIAKREGQVIAGILVNFFGNRATYVHGASHYQYRQLMAPHALQWFAIAQAHARGVSQYDFWGIHPSPNHAWAGITRFKLGFGGEAVEYIGTFELPLNPWLYSLYKFISRFR